MTNLSKLKTYFARYKKKLYLGILFIILSNAGTVYVPLLLKDSIDALKNNISTDLLFKYAGLILAASLFAGIFRFFIRQTIIVVSREIEFDLRNDFWKHMQKLSLRYFQNNSTGNIMAHATNDINAVRMFLGPAVMYSIDTAVRLTIVIAIMISLNFSLTIYTLIPLPILSYLVYRVSKLIHEKFTLIQEKFSDMTTAAQENFSGIRVIKSYIREMNEIKNWEKISRDYLDRNMSMIKIQALFMPLLVLITGISVVIVIWVGGTKIINETMTLGEITAFIAYLSLLIWPIIALGWVMNIIQQGEASMKRLNKITSEKYEIDDDENTDHSIKSMNGEIEFKNVSFRYGESNPEILKNINLKIPSGSTIAIMGYTGSAKTTLVNLIPRLYEPIKGKILIDGIDVNKYPLDVLRKEIALVQQEAFLFSDTIYNNIAYGLPELNKDLVKRASEIAHFDKDVEGFSKGYDTIIGERGITFSGGQKQRAALARALIINPKILILDDSFSAVDTNTEEEILKKLRSFMRERTSIIISHRISTVKSADQIIVLNEGVIAEQGTHDELVNLNGIYAELHFKQLLEKELDELS